MSADKNAPRAQPKAVVAPEPGHFDAHHLPAGQAVDVTFAFVVHLWYGSDPSLSRKPALPRFWLADDRTGVGAAIYAALFDDGAPYPVKQRNESQAGFEARERSWETIRAENTATVDLFLSCFDDPDSWDFHHSLVWQLPDGGLSVTQLSGALPGHPSEAALAAWRKVDGESPF